MSTAVVMPDPPAPPATPHPLAMIQTALEKGCSPDDLKVLFDLYNQHTANLAREAFHRALHAAQQEMPVVVQDAENSQTRSRYAKLETVQKTCRAVWLRHGLTLTFAEEDCPVPDQKRIICDVRHVAGHCVRYHRDLAVDGIGPKGNAIGGMNRVQGAISTGSYGQRILTCDIFDIVVAGTDKDGQGGYVTPDQIGEINDLLIETDANLDSFLQWVGAPSVDKIPEAHLPRVLDMLRRKQARKKGGAA